MMTIYQKYGGWPFFYKMIFELYLDLFDRPEISYHFVGVNIETLSTRQAQILSIGCGAKDIKYEGRPISQVHLQLDISEYQFDEVAKAFREIFLKNGIEPRDVDFIMKFIGRFKKVITSCKISWIDRIMIPIYHIWDKIVFKLKE